MENEKEMYERHKKEIEELQAQCPHTVISDWMPYEFAPGHIWSSVKVCEFCGKTMETCLIQNTVGTTTRTLKNDYWVIS